MIWIQAGQIVCSIIIFVSLVMIYKSNRSEFKGLWEYTRSLDSKTIDLNIDISGFRSQIEEMQVALECVVEDRSCENCGVSFWAVNGSDERICDTCKNVGFPI